jgi:hypothetical protein
MDPRLKAEDDGEWGAVTAGIAVDAADNTTFLVYIIAVRPP